MPSPDHNKFQNGGRNRGEKRRESAHQIDCPASHPNSQQRRWDRYYAHVHRHMSEEDSFREMRQRAQPDHRQDQKPEPQEPHQ
jgi:hypothetical protein